MTATERVLGVLGGMGPLASAHFMVRLTQLTPAASDQEHVPAILWSDPRVPDRTVRAPVGAADPLPWLLRGIDGLERAGCGAIAIPCNTAHRWYEPMQQHARVPILHIVDAAAAELTSTGERRIGVMATEAALEMRLYQDRLGALGWDSLVPTVDEMALLVTPAIRLVKLNRSAEAYAPLAEVAQRLSVRGAAAIVLGCTEIPLGLQAGPAPDLPIVDSIDALARAAIAWARDCWNDAACA
ncbi:MAG TPA: amino acid racemase [Acetobacteraceae bacterium]|nr:amino acid racemase [Acetobacteraceae bacterium]